MIESVFSWLINAIIISIIAAKADEKRGYHIEKHPLLGFFLIFILPTLMEIMSQAIAKKPFIWWILGI